MISMFVVGGWVGRTIWLAYLFLSFFWHCWLKLSGLSSERGWCCPLNCDYSNIEKARKRLFSVEDCFTLIPVMWVDFLHWTRSINKTFMILCSSDFNQIYHTSLYVWVMRDDRVHPRFRKAHTTVTYSPVSSLRLASHVKQQMISF